jgi:DMSO reductase anchor subunit
MNAAMELPLVFFTVLSQAAIGLTLVTGVRRLTSAGSVRDAGRRSWLVAAGLLAAGLAFSLGHLGHPLAAPTALRHLGVSWLSREALLASALAALMVWAALSGLPSLLVAVTAACGLAVLFVQGMTYSPPGFPALASGLPVLFFLISAVTLGAGLAGWFASEAGQAGLARFLAVTLGAGLAVFLVAPLAWLSGGTVQRLTALAYFSSPLYWAHVVLGLAVPLIVVLAARRVPGWLPALLVAGALCGRIVFFLDTVHSAANLGGLY